MGIETVFTGAGKFAFPLYSHKRESDKASKHEKWSPEKHIILTTFAILVDLGFNSAALVLFFSGNRLESAGLKILHNAGSELVPQYITDFKNKAASKQTS